MTTEQQFLLDEWFWFCINRSRFQYTKTGVEFFERMTNRIRNFTAFNSDMYYMYNDTYSKLRSLSYIE